MFKEVKKTPLFLKNLLTNNKKQCIIVTERKRKKEEEERAKAEKLKNYQQQLLTYLRKANAELVDEYEEIFGESVLDSFTMKEKFVYRNQEPEYYICIEGWDRCYSVTETEFNKESYMLNIIK